MDQTPYILALQSIDGLGNIRLKKLLDQFNSDAKALWRAPLSQLTTLPKNIRDNLAQTRKSLDPQIYYQQIQQRRISVVSLFDQNYPAPLKNIYDPPVILYYQGKLPKNFDHSIAIVGARKISGYGKVVTEKFAGELSRAGLTIISGLARGVDTLSHQSALDNQNPTIAVLGGGLSNIYPAENVHLAGKITQNGALISEYPPDTAPIAGNFPQRNRIIAALSVATLVTEADINSGSLITARHALEYGKEVFAVPGQINAQGSRGPHHLIQNGAHLVSEPSEILEILGLEPLSKSTQIIDLSPIEQQLVDSLQHEPKHIDELTRQLNLTSSLLNSTLLKLEIAGLIKNLGSGNYAVQNL